MLYALRALVVQKRLVLMRRVFTVLVVPQMPQTAMMLQMPLVLEVISPAVMAPLVMRPLVVVVMRLRALQLVRMAQMRDIAACLVPAVNYQHKASPLTSRQ